MTLMAAEREALALHGGTPVRKTLLPYGRQSIEEDDIQAVVDVLRSDWLTTGPKVEEFEAAFADYVGAKHAVSFSSGPLPSTLPRIRQGFGPGDEAITSPMTFAATANSVLYQGATPIFADVSPDTLNLDPSRPRHGSLPNKGPPAGGFTPGILRTSTLFWELRNGMRLAVIEDACHALGAEYRGRRVGSGLHMTVFSFHPVKHLATGEEGWSQLRLPSPPRRSASFGTMASAAMRASARLKATGTTRCCCSGFNYRLTDIACSLGLTQLKKLEANLVRRREIAARYDAAFRNLGGVLPPSVRPEAKPAWHLYPVRLGLPRLTVGRGHVFRALRAENIGVNVHYIPVHRHPYYVGRLGDQSGQFPVAEAAYEQLISLPMFHGMDDQDVEDVVRAVEKVMAATTQ